MKPPSLLPALWQLGLLLLLLAGCGPAAFPQESSPINPTWEPPIEYPITVTPEPTSTLTPCGYFPTPHFPLPTVAPTLKSQAGIIPRPDEGVRVEGVREVFISEVISAAGQQEFCLERLILSDLAGDIVAGQAIVPGGTAIITLDVETGIVRQISRVIEQGFKGVQISGRYVAWPEPAPELGDFQSRLQLFDLEQNQLTTLREGLFYDLDFKDNLLVWQAHANQSWNIYGYDLETGQAFTVVESPPFQTVPHICSEEWVVYLQYEPGAQYVMDLYAHHLPTDETILIGQAPAPKDARFGRFHNCDGRYVVWINGNMEEATLQLYDFTTGQTQPQTGEFYHTHHLYDLETRTDRLLNIHPGLSNVRIDGDILITIGGYDIGRDVYFSAIPVNVPLEDKVGGGPLRLSQNRVVWEARPDFEPGRLFTALIIQD